MGFFQALFGRKGADGAGTDKGASGAPRSSTQYAMSSGQSSVGPSSQHALRKDLLKIVLRETLIRNGIPANWIGADLLRTVSPRREPGIHVRLLIRHWDPRLLIHAVAFEQNYFQRLVAMDPNASEWLMGISWQFAMEDPSRCPPLPHPGTWTSAPPEPVRAADAGKERPAAPAVDVIAGPVVIHNTPAGARGDLEKLLAARDEEIKRQDGKDSFAATQPVSL